MLGSVQDAMLKLDLLGVVHGGAKCDCQIAGHVARTHWQDRRVHKLPFMIERYGRDAAADVHEQYAVLFLVLIQDGFCRGKRSKNKLRHFDACRIDTLRKISNIWRK